MAYSHKVYDYTLYDLALEVFDPKATPLDVAFSVGRSAGHVAVQDGDTSDIRQWQDAFLLPFGVCRDEIDSFNHGWEAAHAEATTERIML